MKIFFFVIFDTVQPARPGFNGFSNFPTFDPATTTESSKFVRFEDPPRSQFATPPPSPPPTTATTTTTPRPPPSPVTSPVDPNGFRSTVVHDPNSQSSSFFSFQRPGQPQQQSFTQFNQFPTTSPTTTSQFSQFPASTTQFSQFNQFQTQQQQQQQRFQQQPFTVFNNNNNNNNQAPRFVERPSPSIGPSANLTPGSQLQQAFFSVFPRAQPQRAQRAITSGGNSAETSSEVSDSAEYRFPRAEFGGFVPVSQRGQVDRL